MTELRVPIAIYIVATDPHSARHHGLHTNHAPHCLTMRPQPGDRIVARLEGERHLVPRTEGGYRTVAVGLTVEGRVERHAGRSALLGEDGLEDAYGGDALAELIPELIDGADWNYAPVEYSEGETRWPSWVRRDDGRLVPDGERPFRVHGATLRAAARVRWGHRGT